MSNELNKKQQFIVDMYPAALKVSQETGMSWQLILAQAAQETGWGEKVLPGTNNIFNIKANGGWDGPTKTFNVWEIENGKKVWRDEPFRVYGSTEEALKDRVEFLRENSRYAKAGLFEPGTLGNLEKEAQALQRAGYATDPDYAKKLVEVFNGPTMQKAIAYAQAHPQQGTSELRPNTPSTPAAANTSPMADGQLKRGEEGPEVKRLQDRLNNLGYGRADGTPLVENGKFGPNTEAALIKFQQEHGLQGLGVAGPKTFAALDAAEKAQAQGGQTQTTPPAGPAQNPGAAKAPASHAIYSEAYQHFLADGNKFEYGRGDMSLNNKEGNRTTDRSRTEQDLDKDGLKGVDCSSFVWRGLKNAGYDVPKEPFSTHALFNGNQITDYSKKHFDVISAADAKKANGPLQPGDVVLFKDKDSGGQHVGIVKGYDSKGNLEFIGSQVSTGPAAAKAGPGSYWNGGDFEIVGALRAKPEFQVRAPLHGTPDAPAGQTPQTQTPGANSTPASPMADGQLKRGEEGPEVKRLQDRLNNLGYGRADGTPLVENGKFGPNTEAALIKFQQEHGLQGLGVAGPKTFAALDAAEKAQAQGGQTPVAQAPAGQGSGAQAQGGIALNAAHDMSIKYDHVKYGFGDKNLASGKVDCSGWVSQLQNATMEEINQKAGKPVFAGKDFFDKNNQSAADIIKDSVNTTGTFMRSPLDASKLKEGMIIGEDNGNKGWDAGRYKGIDHITMVVKDPKSGELMISQSRGGEGVELMPLDKYLQRKQANGVELFATDPLAKARPLIEGPAHQERSTTSLLSTKHPDNGMFLQAFNGIGQLPSIPAPLMTEASCINAAGGLVCASKDKLMTSIDSVIPLKNGNVGSVQGPMDSASNKVAMIDPQVAAQQPIEKSSELAMATKAPVVEEKPTKTLGAISV
jgi:peptidoglycan hydrolase-like protein with peptidoglycan-binding domain